MHRNLAESSKPHTFRTKESRFVTIVCFVLLMISVYYWLVTKADGSPAGQFGALVNAALFAALGIRFVPIWVHSWSRPEGMTEGISAFNQRDQTVSAGKMVSVKVFCAFLLIDGLIILLIYILQVLSGSTISFRQALDIWRSVDSAHYLDIARDWYVKTGNWDRMVQLVFLPGYPLLVRIINPVIRNDLVSGLIVSGVCFAGAATVLYRLVRLDHSHTHAVQVLKYLCILPGAFFFAAPMSESLFLLLSVSSIYLLRKKDWFAACVLAGAAAFTRTLGLVLLVPVLFEMITDSVETAAREQASKASHEETSGKAQHISDNKKLLLRNAAKYWNLIFILFGFGCYLFINYQASGNPFQFLIYQKEHWSQSLGFFFNTAAYQIDYARGTLQAQDYQYLLGLWLPNLTCIFLSLILMLVAVKKLRPAYTAYFLIYYVIAIGATWLLSAPRYLSTLFPIPMALAAVSEKRWLDAALTIGLTIFFVLYAYMFVNRWGVY